MFLRGKNNTWHLFKIPWWDPMLSLGNRWNKNKNIKMKTVTVLPAWRSSYHFEGPWHQTTAAALKNAWKQSRPATMKESRTQFHLSPLFAPHSQAKSWGHQKRGQDLSSEWERLCEAAWVSLCRSAIPPFGQWKPRKRAGRQLFPLPTVSLLQVVIWGCA